MSVLVRYFGGAAEAAGTESERLAATTLGELVEAMCAAHPGPLAEVLGRCSLLVDGTRTSDPAAPLSGAAQVDVLPPFSGG